MRRLDWADYRAAEFDGIDAMRTIAVLPTAAIEQHGPHLPVGTDTMIAQGMLDEVRGQLPDDLDVRILPVQAVGKSNEHLFAAGTLTLTAATALAAWTEIGLSVARAGVRKLVVVNSHGGNLDLVSILSRELRVRAGMLCVKCQWGGFGHPEGMFPEDERRYGIHGGDVETSLMLHFRPELVDMTLARDFTSLAAETDARFKLLAPTGTHAFAWMARDLNEAGVVGNAAAASAEKGRAVAEHQARGFVALLSEVRAVPLSEGFGAF
jgi:creatinine amidohydrolase